MPYPDWTEDTFWIVRSAGERTTHSCAALIGRIVPPERIRIIEERPFAAAIRKTFELAADSGCTWTACIDADVYIHERGWERLFEIARSVKPKVWYVQGLTVDKYIPIIRTAGTGIYRSSITPLALSGIPADGSSLRPETTTMQRMIQRGYLMYRTPVVVGMHDFGQHYHDIARKAMLHYRKHANVKDEMIEYWTNQSSHDADFRAALLGAELAERFEGDLMIDRAFQQQEIQTGLIDIGLPPKPDLPAGEVTAEYVGKYLAEFRPDAELQEKKFPQYRDYTLMWPPRPIHERVISKIRRIKQRLLG